MNCNDKELTLEEMPAILTDENKHNYIEIGISRKEVI